MTYFGPFSIEPAPDRRTLRITDAAGRAVASLRFGLPGQDAPEWEADEEEVALTTSERLRARLTAETRDDACTVSVSLDNVTAEPLAVPLEASVETGGGYTGWCWTARLDAVLVFSPRDGSGPSLAVSLREGYLSLGEAVEWAAQDPPVSWPLLLSPVGEPLRAHGRRTVRLRLEAVADADAAASLLPPWLPATTVPVDDDIALDAPDMGIVADPGVTVTTLGTVSHLSGPPGKASVALHDARGGHVVPVSWVPTLAQTLATVAAEFGARPPVSATPAEGLFVVEAGARGLYPADAAVAWAEQADWLAGRGLLGIATAARLAVLSSDAGLLEDAWRAVEETEPGPGFGLTVMRIWLAGMSLGDSEPRRAQELLQRRVVDQVAAIENALLGHRSEEVPGAALWGLVGALGGSLPGRSLSLTPRDAAIAAALVRLCPENWAGAARAAAAADKTELALLADIAGPSRAASGALDGLAWLVLGQLGI